MRLYRRWDGTVLTRDCPVGLQRARMRVAAAMATAAAFVAVLLFPVLVKLGAREAPDEHLTFEERLDELRWKSYDWPVIGFVMEKVYPPPRAIMGVIRPPPEPRGSGAAHSSVFWPTNWSFFSRNRMLKLVSEP